MPQRLATEVDDAENTLREYLMALHTGDYVRAAKLYSGDTSLLQTWNSDIPNADPATLFERACSQNGLQCLAPRSITYRASEVDGHHFWVEFNNADGTLFQQGPCCGETTGTPVSMFPFFVEKSLSRQWLFRAGFSALCALITVLLFCAQTELRFELQGLSAPSTRHHR